ncbi:MAG: type I pullulanase [Marinilabiliales bacterium]|nr:type I pullulanase [Marinilabiliales bacterium]
MRDWVFHPADFESFPVYAGDDLGVHLLAGELSVRIWAPSAQEVLFRLYPAASSPVPLQTHSLSKSEAGTWAIHLTGDFEGDFYTFQVRDAQGWLNECPDPGAKATGVNGMRGIILDFEKSHPEGWSEDKRSAITDPADMVLYETHVRDFSISPDSGIHYKGKYLGFTESGSRSPEGEKTGLDHLTELGITHLHLLPIADFYTVDETLNLPQYNWGYDPINFNTPEGWYATNPYDGYSRIREFKSLVKALHDKGIGVIMDVVYNHSGLIFDSWFNQTVPGYYYRQRSDGTLSDASGCGNEIASERAMVRKFILDSVAWWVETYHLDGFRFDLMGVLDIDTMNQIRVRLDAIDKNIFLYGEGWTAAESPLPEHQRAVKRNTPQLDRIASFCDDMRDGLKGSPFNRYSHGFISGLTLREERVKFSITGAIFHPQIIYDYVDSSRQPWANSPEQCINYVACHDNYTLFDKLQYSCPEATPAETERMTRLAIGILLTAQGVPFLHAGMEMHRSKNGHHDSYRSPDEVNRIEWSRKTTYHSLFAFTRDCIELRREHPAFRMKSAEMVREKLYFFPKYIPGVIVYQLMDHANGDSWKQIVVLLNGNNYSVEYEIPDRRWLIVARDGELSLQGMGHVHTGKVRIHPISMMILAEE